jgi:hypothetical protein
MRLCAWRPNTLQALAFNRPSRAALIGARLKLQSSKQGSTMPITEPLNPRAVPGSNEAPDYAQQVTDRIAAEYAEITVTLDNLLAEAREMPKEVDSDDADA